MPLFYLCFRVILGGSDDELDISADEDEPVLSGEEDGRYLLIYYLLRITIAKYTL